jgi:cell division septum initiation protein DivIVA
VPGEPFKITKRGYSPVQVHEFIMQARRRVGDLEKRLAQAAVEVERLRSELASAEQAAAGRPTHEEISERIAEILRLADEEAKAQRTRADEEISRLRSQAEEQADTRQAEASSQAKRILTTAEEQAHRTISNAQAEADATADTARAAADQATAEAQQRAEATVARAVAQAGQVLAEATARADAVHGGTERRLSQLTDGHADVMQRLTAIRDIVTDLVARDTARGPLRDEVASATAAALAAGASEAARSADVGQVPAAQDTAPSPREPGGEPPAKGSGRDLAWRWPVPLSPAAQARPARVRSGPAASTAAPWLTLFTGTRQDGARCRLGRLSASCVIVATAVRGGPGRRPGWTRC